MHVPHMLVHRAWEREGQGVREREARRRPDRDEAVWVRQTEEKQVLPALAPLRLGCVLLWGPSVLWVWPLSPPWPRL